MRYYSLIRRRDELARLRQVMAVLFRHGFGYVVYALRLGEHVPFVSRYLKRDQVDRPLTFGERLRRFLGFSTGKDKLLGAGRCPPQCRLWFNDFDVVDDTQATANTIVATMGAGDMPASRLQQARKIAADSAVQADYQGAILGHGILRKAIITARSQAIGACDTAIGLLDRPAPIPV